MVKKMYEFLVEFFATHVDEYAELASAKLIHSPEMLRNCALNHCGKYNRNWMCPPALENSEALLESLKNRFGKVFLFSKIRLLRDPFDIENMEAGRKTVERLLEDFRKKVYFPHQILAPGACGLCETCAYPDSCRFPELASPSLEALGINVTELAKACGIRYHNGPNTVTYFAAILYD